MNPSTRALLIVAIVALLGVGVWWALANRSTPVNDNTAPANTNSDTVVPAGWSTYSSPTYGFAISHPPELTAQANTLSDTVVSLRGDGLVADVGFYLPNPQGPLFGVFIFAKPLAEVVAKSDLVGPLTGTVKTIGNLQAREISRSIRGYGIEGPDYTYVVSVQNYGSDADLDTFDRMLTTFRLQ